MLSPQELLFAWCPALPLERQDYKASEKRGQKAKEAFSKHSLPSWYLASLILNILFKEKKASINNFMCIIIPHKDSADVSPALFLCRRAENGFVLWGFLLQSYLH